MWNDLCLHYAFSLWNNFYIWLRGLVQIPENSMGRFLLPHWALNQALKYIHIVCNTQTPFAQVQNDNAFDKSNQKLQRGLVAFFKPVTSFLILKTRWPGELERMGWSWSKKNYESEGKPGPNSAWATNWLQDLAQVCIFLPLHLSVSKMVTHTEHHKTKCCIWPIVLKQILGGAGGRGES